MPRFRFVLFRDVVVQDTYDYEIEADSLEAAEEQARADCAEFDHDCPDDIVSADIVAEIGDWQIDTEISGEEVDGH